MASRSALAAARLGVGELGVAKTAAGLDLVGREAGAEAARLGVICFGGDVGPQSGRGGRAAQRGGGVTSKWGGGGCVVAQVRPSSRSKTAPRPKPTAAALGTMYLA